MSKIDTQFYKKKNTRLVVSVVIFALTLIATVLLYLYNNSLSSSIAELKQENQTLEDSIVSSRSDDEIASYELYTKNRKILEKKSCESEIPFLLLHLKRSASNYGFSFKQVSFSDDAITTSLTMNSDSQSAAYEKVSTLLKEYSEQETAFLDFSYIDNFEGFDEITFDQSFTLNPSFYEDCL